MTFIVATNVIASRPPERRPTGTPHARAKIAWHTLGWKGNNFFFLNPLKNNLPFVGLQFQNKTWSSVSNSSFLFFVFVFNLKLR